MSTMPSCLASTERCVGGGAGNGLGQVEQGRVFALAEILGQKQLRQADDLRPARRCLMDLVDRTLQIFIGVGRGATFVSVRQ